VFADAFDMKELRKKPRNKQPTDDLAASASDQPVGEVDYPAADAELWAALDQGKKLYAILDDFYTIVYDDPRLSPFFQRVTKQRSIEKVSLFLRQVFSGEKVYFGDRPRNAHHWMVISDDLFDYRESIMERCLRDHGLPEHLIARWLAVEESFRPDIVKDRAWKKVVNGVELPLDGYEELELDSGALCDSCQQAIDAGTRVRYHLRLGTVYCPSCMHDQPDAEDPAGSGSRGDVSL
jgi:truncated hemoglobin YjbI